MKLLIILSIIISTNLFGQNPFFFWDDTTGSSYAGELKVPQYAVPLNGTTQYLSKTTPELQLGGYSLSETFSDGDYNGWTVSSGSYAVVDSVGYSGLAKSLRCATAGIIYIPCNQAYGVWTWDWRKGGDGNVFNYAFISSKTEVNNTELGYFGTKNNNEAVRLLYNAGTGGNNLLTSANSYITNFTSYRDSLVRNTNGSFSLYIKGGTFGSVYTLVSTTGGSGTNPVTNNTYTQSNYFVLDLDAGDMIANIQCQYGSGSLDLNGHEMVDFTIDKDMEVGSEVITNGSFGSNITGWDGGSGTTPKWYNADWDGVSRTNAILDSAIAVSDGFVRAAYSYSKNVRYKLTYTYYIPSSNTTTAKIAPYTNALLTIRGVTDTWTTVTEYFIPSADITTLRFYLLNASGSTTNSATVGDKIYIDDVSIKPVSYWATNGTATADTSSTQKYAGSYSLRDVTTLGSELNSIPDWANINYDSYSETNDSLVVSGVTNDYCRNDIITFTAGETYQISYLAQSITGTHVLRGNTSGTTFHTILSGTNTFSITFAQSEKLRIACTSNGALTIENISFKKSSGDSTTNYMSLAATNFTAIESGKKYTAEVFVQGVGVKGGNVIPDSASLFNTAIGGITYWSLIRGVLTYNSGSQDVTLTANTGGSNTMAITKASLLSTNQCYEITFQAKSSNVTSKIWGFAGTSSSDYTNTVAITQPNLTSSYQNYKFITQSSSTTLYIAIPIQMLTSGVTEFTVDSINVKPITKPTYTIVVGDKASTSDTISIIPGVFEKVVFNFQATASTVGQAIKIYCSQADTGYFDSFSLTQAKDAMWTWWQKIPDINSHTVISLGATNTNTYFIRNVGTLAGAFVSDGISAINGNISTSTMTYNSYQHLTVILDRSAQTIKTYINGVLDKTNSSVNIGRLNNLTTLMLGRISYTPAWYFSSELGEVQITTFDDIAAVNYTPLQLYTRGKNSLNFPTSYTNGTIVGWWFKSKSFNDNSASANNLTGTSVNATDMIEVDY